MSTNSKVEVMDLYERWRKAWLTVDTELMLSLYDMESDDLAYQSEENAGPIYTGQDLRKYWTAAKNIVDAVPVWEEISKKVVISPEYAFIYVLLKTAIVAPAFGGRIDGEIRATLGCRKRNGKWYIIQYHEGRQMEAATAAGIKQIYE